MSQNRKIELLFHPDHTVYYVIAFPVSYFFHPLRSAGSCRYLQFSNLVIHLTHLVNS